MDASLCNASKFANIHGLPWSDFFFFKLCKSGSISDQVPGQPGTMSISWKDFVGIDPKHKLILFPEVPCPGGTWVSVS